MRPTGRSHHPQGRRSSALQMSVSVCTATAGPALLRGDCRPVRARADGLIGEKEGAVPVTMQWHAELEHDLACLGIPNICM